MLDSISNCSLGSEVDFQGSRLTLKVLCSVSEAISLPVGPHGPGMITGTINPFPVWDNGEDTAWLAQRDTKKMNSQEPP